MLALARRLWCPALLVALLGCDGGTSSAPDAAIDPDRGSPDGPLADARPMDADAPDASTDGAVVDALAPAIPDAGPVVDGTPPGPPACDPPLHLEPATAVTVPGGLVLLRPSGGTGEWRFTLADAASAGRVDADAAAYLAGPTPGTDDVVLTDLGCAGEARARITVVPPLSLAPQRIEVGPGEAFDFTTEGGSGALEWRMVFDRSGGVVDEHGRYTAGPTPGTDLVEVVDRGTGRRADALVDVVPAPRFTLTPDRLGLVLGATTRFAAAGGSGHLAVDVQGAAAEVDPTTFAVTGVEPGIARVTVTDRFTGRMAEARVQVAGPLDAPLVRAHGTISVPRTAVGDLDGDGHADVVMGLDQASVEARADGGVYVWRGGANGLEPMPTQVLGAVAGDLFGSAVALLDVDGDGRLDLAAGAMRAEGGTFDSGAIRIHRGLEGAAFAPEPMQLLVARDVRAELGAQLAACDVDGDGRDDLIAGLRRGELWVYRGTAAGLETTPSAVVTGTAPGPDGWVELAGAALALGSSRSALATGDVDGDGRCDVVAGVVGWTRDDEARDDGAVYVWSGARLADADGPVAPDRAWLYDVPEGRGSLFGELLAVADLDGDGRDEVAVGVPRLDLDGAADAGAAYVFAGAPFDAPIARSAADAIFVRRGQGYAHRTGWGVAAADISGDGVAELVVASAVRDGEPTIEVWSGGDRPAGEPDRTLRGGPREAETGHHLAVLPDGPRAVWFAGADPDLGYRVGAPWTAVLDDMLVPARLQYPGAASAGARIGQAVRAVDADGVALLAVGAPGMADPGPDQGAVWLHRPDDDRAPFGRLTSRHIAFGEGLAAGDFDGDGRDDLAVWSGRGQRSAVDADTHRVDGACVFDGAATGVVEVFRGQPGGFAEQPAFVWYGQRHIGWPVMADVNGDGRADLVAGHNAAGPVRDVGGIEIVLGRPADVDGRAVVLCDPVFTYAVPERGDWAAWLGVANAALGDLDGDGCEDVAFGAHGETPVGEINIRHGVLRVLFGWGGPGCPAGPSVAAVSPRIIRQSFGTTLAAGDLTGDGIADVAVAADEGNWVQVVDGAWLARQPRAPFAWPVDAAPSEPPETVPLRVHGLTGAEGFGRGLAVVDGRLIVGFATRTLPDSPAVGGADVYRVAADRLVLEGRFIGETWRTGGLVGHAITALGPGRFALGAPGSSGLQPAAGAIYVFDLP